MAAAAAAARLEVLQQGAGTAASTSVLISPETSTRPEGGGGARCLIVGRQAATADIRIQHGSISRKHAVLYYLKNHDDDHNSFRLMLTDLGSKYGTTVNDQKMEPKSTVALRNGDTVLFGNVRESVFVVRREDSQQEQEPSPGGGARTAASDATASTAADSTGTGSNNNPLLTDREKRQAEIAAMVASLEEKPTYQKYQGNDNDNATSAAASIATMDQAAQTTAKKYLIPIQHQLHLESESERRSATTCLAVDASGSRFAVGSTDTTLRLYHFGGMDRLQQRAFAAVIPDDGHWLVDCCFSSNAGGDRILVGTGSVQPRVLDRDGANLVVKFVRGDMYVNDQTKTVGHTAAVSAVAWHPLERDVVLTASRDGSARLWNLAKGRLQFDMLTCDKVFPAKSARGQRTAVLCVAFHPAGRELALGTACGSLQIWKTACVALRPERVVYDAHGSGDRNDDDERPVSSLTYNEDGTRLASRSHRDDVVRIWNPQRLSRSSQPVVQCAAAPTIHEQANCAFGPIAAAGGGGAQILCVPVAVYGETAATVTTTGAEGQPRRESGGLNFYKVSGVVDGAVVQPLFSTMSLEEQANDSSSPVLVQWHSKINQIFVGWSNGDTVIYYDPSMSVKGAMVVEGRAGKRVDDLTQLLQSRAPQGSAAITGEIFTPLTQQQQHQKRKRKLADEAAASTEPERPTTFKHKTGGQVGGSLNFQQFVADQSMGKRKEIAGKDPREALFRYAKTAAEGSEGNKTNESKLADKTAEEEEAEEAERKSSQ